MRYSGSARDDETYQTLLFEACHPKVAHYCQQKKLPYPAIDENAEIIEPIADSATFTDDRFAGWVKRNGSMR
jgi:hypothetical protein